MRTMLKPSPMLSPGTVAVVVVGAWPGAWVCVKAGAAPVKDQHAEQR